MHNVSRDVRCFSFRIVRDREAPQLKQTKLHVFDPWAPEKYATVVSRQPRGVGQVLVHGLYFARNPDATCVNILNKCLEMYNNAYLIFACVSLCYWRTQTFLSCIILHVWSCFVCDHASCIMLHMLRVWPTKLYPKLTTSGIYLRFQQGAHDHCSRRALKP